MNDERLKFQGRLVDTQLAAKRAEIAARGLVKSLRELLDPFAAPGDIDPEQVVDQALRLSDQISAWRQATEQAEAIKKALGR